MSNLSTSDFELDKLTFLANSDVSEFLMYPVATLLQIFLHN